MYKSEQLVAQQLFWLARFNVQRETLSSRRAVCTVSFRVNPRPWFRSSSCLFMCTLLELFVYLSLVLSALAGAMRKIVRTVNRISLVDIAKLSAFIPTSQIFHRWVVQSFIVSMIKEWLLSHFSFFVHWLGKNHFIFQKSITIYSWAIYFLYKFNFDISPTNVQTKNIASWSYLINILHICVAKSTAFIGITTWCFLVLLCATTIRCRRFIWGCSSSHGCDTGRGTGRGTGHGTGRDTGHGAGHGAGRGAGRGKGCSSCRFRIFGPCSTWNVFPTGIGAFSTCSRCLIWRLLLRFVFLLA